MSGETASSGTHESSTSGSNTPESSPRKSSASKKASSSKESKVATSKSRKVAGPEQLSSYAVVRTGGRQYVVTPGMKLYVNKLDGEVGDKIELTEVLLVKSDANGEAKIGTPLVSGAVVKARLLAQERDKKVIVFKKRRRKGYTKKQGHRQYISQIEVESISA